MRFYVYELIDPRDGLPFYVGKGVNWRLHAHENEAKKGATSRKATRIREIWEARLIVQRRIVARFRTEEAAYAFEAEYIAAIGLHNLTNINRGGRGGWANESRPPQLKWTAQAILKMALSLKRVLWCMQNGAQGRVVIKTASGERDMTGFFTAFLRQIIHDVGRATLIEILGSG